MRLFCSPLLLLTLAPLTACGGSQLLQERVSDAERERDALRVAYEAQQLRLKELSERVLALEDRLLLEASPSRGDAEAQRRVAGLWGRPSTRQRAPDLSALPVVRLSRGAQGGAQGSDPSTSSSHPQRSHPQRSHEPPMSAQAMRDARLSRGGRPTGDDVPTLTADNISEFKRLGAQQGSPEGAQEPDEARAKRRKRRTYEAPEGAEDATSLGVVPLPPRQRLSASTSGSSAITSAALAPSMARASLTPLPVIEGQDHSPQASDHLTAQQPQEPQEPPSQGSSEGSLELAFAQAARHLEAARWGEAIKAHELLISLTPNTQLRSKARYGLALALKGSGRHQEATSAFRALIQGDPAGALVPQALLEIGALQLSSGERAKGRATLMRLKSLYPQTSAARRADGLLP